MRIRDAKAACGCERHWLAI